MSANIDMTGWEYTTLTGYGFLRETLDPPEAFFNGNPHNNELTCGWLEVENMKIPIYYTDFYLDGEVFSRMDICKAWSYGFHGSYFHDVLIYHLQKKVWTDPTLEVDIDRLRIARREWHGAFVVLNFALTILYETERSHLIPPRWITPGQYNKYDLELSYTPITGRAASSQLTSLYLIAAEHLIQLHDDVGYKKEFRDLADRLREKDGLVIQSYHFPGPSDGVEGEPVTHQIVDQDTEREDDERKDEWQEKLDAVEEIPSHENKSFGNRGAVAPPRVGSKSKSSW
ncbi:hypothetical protein V866_000619 [Kwoniella sp. B9012]